MTLAQSKQLTKILNEISVKGPYTEAEIKFQAIEHYKSVWENTPFMLESIEKASDKQLEQWMVNFIRHKLTDYNEALVKVNESIPGGYQILKISVLDKIACMYPFLKNECERQKSEFYHRIW